MSDNLQLPTAATAGDKVAADDVTYSADTAKVQLVRLVHVTGAEGSKTVVALDPVATEAAALATATAAGAQNDAAAAADGTGNYGVIGALKRALLNWAALLARLPASLGIKTAANSLSVAPASDAKFVVQQAPAALTNISGTVTAGGTAQNAAAANAARVGFWIMNLSAGDLWISTLAAAAASQPALKLTAGTYYEAPPGGAGTGAISVFGATTGQAWAGREW